MFGPSYAPCCGREWLEWFSRPIAFQLVFALPGSVILGVPLYALLIGRVRPRMSVTALGGACIGAIIGFAASTVMFGDLSGTLGGLGGFGGAFGGIVFWLCAMWRDPRLHGSGETHLGAGEIEGSNGKIGKVSKIAARVFVALCVIVAVLAIAMRYIDNEYPVPPAHRVADEHSVNGDMKYFLMSHGVKVDSTKSTFTGLTIVDSEFAGFQDYEESFMFEVNSRSEKIFARIFEKLHGVKNCHPIQRLDEEDHNNTNAIFKRQRIDMFKTDPRGIKGIRCSTEGGHTMFAHYSFIRIKTSGKDLFFMRYYGG